MEGMEEDAQDQKVEIERGEEKLRSTDRNWIRYGSRL